jgi:hypothetical protein
VKARLAAADNTGVTTFAAPPPPLNQMIPPALPTAPAASPLSEEHLRQLAASHAATLKIRRAINVARADGWGVACAAALTLLSSFTSVSGVVVAAALGAVAVVELKMAARLRRFDVSAPRVLALNQVALGGLLIAYAVLRIYQELNGAGEYAAMVASDPEVGRALQPFEHLTRLVALSMYGGLIAVAILAQGGLALYYFTRTRHLRAYLEQTPPWIVAVQKAGRLA